MGSKHISRNLLKFFFPFKSFILTILWREGCYFHYHFTSGKVWRRESNIHPKASDILIAELKFTCYALTLVQHVPDWSNKAFLSSHLASCEVPAISEPPPSIFLLHHVGLWSSCHNNHISCVRPEQRELTPCWASLYLSVCLLLGIFTPFQFSEYFQDSTEH